MESQAGPMKEKKYFQKYTKTWKSDPNLKDWIAPDPSGDCKNVYCKYCRLPLKAHKKSLIEHGSSKKHQSSVQMDKAAKSCRPLVLVKPPIDKYKIAELKLTAFIAEHTSISTVNHLGELLKIIDPTSEIFNNLKLHRTKCSMLIKNVLSPCMLNDLIADIGNSPYSLVIDESTDVSTQKILCVMIRYFSSKKSTIVTTFYHIIKIVDATAIGIHSALTTQLEADGFSIQNLIGIGVDGVSVIVGVKNSVAALLKKELPDLIVMKCVCHSLHLCAETAAEVLPRQLEYLVREIHNWFSYSPKRKDEYKDLYKTMNDGVDRDPKK